MRVDRPSLYAVTRGVVGPHICTEAERVLKVARVARLQMRLRGDRPKLFETAVKLRGLCDRYGVKLIVNNDPHLAKEAGAHGLHLGQGDMSPRQARRIVGPGIEIGLTVDTWAQLLGAALLPVDLVAIQVGRSTANPTGRIWGESHLGWAVKMSPRPVIAIGGLSRENIGRVSGFGVEALAIGSRLWDFPRQWDD